jgi:hypothetical protein
LVSLPRLAIAQNSSVAVPTARDHRVIERFPIVYFSSYLLWFGGLIKPSDNQPQLFLTKLFQFRDGLLRVNWIANHLGQEPRCGLFTSFDGFPMLRCGRELRFQVGVRKWQGAILRLYGPVAAGIFGGAAGLGGHEAWRWKNDAREAREIFSAKGAITGRQFVVPHFGFASG